MWNRIFFSGAVRFGDDVPRIHGKQLERRIIEEKREKALCGEIYNNIGIMKDFLELSRKPLLQHIPMIIKINEAVNKNGFDNVELGIDGELLEELKGNSEGLKHVIDVSLPPFIKKGKETLKNDGSEVILQAAYVVENYLTEINKRILAIRKFFHGVIVSDYEEYVTGLNEAMKDTVELLKKIDSDLKVMDEFIYDASQKM